MGRVRAPRSGVTSALSPPAVRASARTLCASVTALLLAATAAQAGADALFDRAVAVAAAAEHLVPRTMVMRTQEHSADGKLRFDAGDPHARAVGRRRADLRAVCATSRTGRQSMRPRRTARLRHRRRLAVLRRVPGRPVGHGRRRADGRAAHDPRAAGDRLPRRAAGGAVHDPRAALGRGGRRSPGAALHGRPSAALGARPGHPGDLRAARRAGAGHGSLRPGRRQRHVPVPPAVHDHGRAG